MRIGPTLPGRAALLAALLCFTAAARAEWTIVATQSLGQPAPGVEVVETRLERANPQGSARLVAVLFDTRSHTLRVVDSPEPGQATLSTVLTGRNAIAGVNGGYFQPDFTPVGLAIADGKTLQPFKKAKLLSGILTISPKGSVSILRSGRFNPKPGTYRQALQCGPMLLENSAPVPGLNAEKIARRTLVATGPGQRVALIYLTSVSLADASRILALPKILGTWSPTNALNLDGGSSSALWARNTITLPEIKRVRNFVAVVPK